MANKHKISIWINKLRKSDIVYIITSLIIAFSAYLGFGSGFKYLENNVAQQFMAGAFAAIFVTMVTFFLLNRQQRAENEKKVFEAKIELYKSVVQHLADIIITKDSKNLATTIETDLLILTSIAEDETIQKFYDILKFTQEKDKYDLENENYTFFSDADSDKRSNDTLEILIDKITDFAGYCRKELGLKAGVNLSGLSRVVITKSIAQTIKTTEENKRQRDYTKYNLELKTKNGETNKISNLGKGRAALAIMKHLIAEKIMSTQKDIEEIGNEKYAGKLHLLMLFKRPVEGKIMSEYIQGELNSKGIDPHKYYFIDDDEILVREDINAVIIVCSQWGIGNFPSFLSDIENKYGDYVKYSEVK